MKKEIGMCQPLNDRDFFDLLTNNSKENLNLIKKYYPELQKFIK